MYKTVFAWVFILFFANLLFLACSSEQTQQIQVPLNNSDELIALKNDSKFVNPDIKVEEKCLVKNVNEFTKQFCDDDHDQLLNIQELKYKTDPENPDTDNDAYLDGEEIRKHYNPLGFGDYLPEKYKDCEYSSQAWCWSGQAYYKADPEICNNIDDRRYLAHRKEKCFADAQKEKDKIQLEIALSDLNFDECNKIKDEEILKDCQKELAFALGAVKADKNYCLQKFGFSKIKKDEKITLERELQHRCWFAMAVASNDIDACDKLDEHVIKDFDKVACVSKIARLNNNPEICDKLKEMGLERAIPRCLGQDVIPANDK